MGRVKNVQAMIILICRYAAYLVVTCCLLSTVYGQVIESPDRHIVVHIEPGEQLRLNLEVDGHNVMRVDSVLLVLTAPAAAKLIPVALHQASKSVRDTIIPPVHEKRNRIPDLYNELRLEMQGGWALTVRVFDDGFAYRCETMLPDSITVGDEHALFHLSPEDSVWASVVEPRDSVDRFQTSYENQYSHTTPDSLPTGKPIVLPLVIETKGGGR